VKGVTLTDIRAITQDLPRSEEHLIYDRVKFRVRSLVYVAVSQDETLMGFAFPKEEREALIASEPEKFLMPVKSDERYNWVRVRLAEIDEIELRELVVEAWRMCVPKFISAMVD
jgi:hypothetical protein